MHVLPTPLCSSQPIAFQDRALSLSMFWVTAIAYIYEHTFYRVDNSP
jgi:hypothetical protein